VFKLESIDGDATAHDPAERQELIDIARDLEAATGSTDVRLVASSTSPSGEVEPPFALAA
jgi:hypothetical protein